MLAHHLDPTCLSTKYSIMTLIPLLAMLFDWLENIGVIVLLKSYPHLSSWQVHIPSISGMLKMCCLASSMIIVIFLFLLNLMTRLHKKATAK